MAWEQVGSLPIAAGDGKLLLPAIQQNIFTSTTVTFPKKGALVIRAMGGGGGGGSSSAGSATGGYSGSWGIKYLPIEAGTTAVVVIGAGGRDSWAAPAGPKNGGNTTVTINGVTYTATGGWGGLVGSATPPPPMPDIDPLWDFGARGAKPGWVATGVTGGAAVDIMALRLGSSASVAFSGGGGVASGTWTETSTTGGGSMPYYTEISGANALGATTAMAFDAGADQWGISFCGGYGTGNNGAGGNGSTGGTGGSGGNGGGGGGGVNGGRGGLGAGGGGGTTGFGNAGGNGFVHLKYFVELEL